VLCIDLDDMGKWVSRSCLSVMRVPGGLNSELVPPQVTRRPRGGYGCFLGAAVFFSAVFPVFVVFFDLELFLLFFDRPFLPLDILRGSGLNSSRMLLSSTAVSSRVDRPFWRLKHLFGLIDPAVSCRAPQSVERAGMVRLHLNGLLVAGDGVFVILLEFVDQPEFVVVVGSSGNSSATLEQPGDLVVLLVLT